MARQVNTEIIGCFGRVHYYKWRGVYYMRKMPRKESMTPGTLEQAGIFGRAARISALLRKLLEPVIADPKNRKNMHRFNYAIASWLRTDPFSKDTLTSQPHLSGYEFNEESELGSLLKISLSVHEVSKGNFVLKIPALIPATDINAPAGTKAVLWNIIVACCNEKEMTCNSYTTKLVITYNEEILEEQEVILPLEVPADSLIVVATGLNFSITGDRSGIIHDIQWKPGRIIQGSIRKG